DALSKEPGKVENEPKPDELAAVKEETGDKKTPSEQEALERVEEIPAKEELQTSMDLVSDETPVSAEAQPEGKAPENQPQTVYEEPPLETDGSPVKHEEDALSKEPGKVENEPKPDELAAVEEETGDKKFPSEQEALERVEEMPAQGELQTSKIDSSMDSVSDEIPVSTEAQLEEKAPEDQPQTVYEEPPLETDGSPVKHEEDALSKEPGKVENEPKPDELAAVKEETGDKKTPSEQEALERVEEIPAQGELQTSMDLVSDETPVSAEAQPEEKAPEDQPQTVYEEPPLETDGSPVKHEEDALSKELGKVENEPKPDELAAVQEETGDKKIPSEQEALERVEEIPAHGEFQTSKIKEEIDDNVKMSSEEEASGRLEVRQNRDKQKESLVESGPQEVGSVSTKEYEWPTEHESKHELLTASAVESGQSEEQEPSKASIIMPSTALPEQEMKPEMCAKDELSIEQELFEQMKHENELPKELAENVIADEEASFLEQSNNEQFGTKMSVGSVEKEFQEKENIMPPEGPDETVDRKLVESSAQHSSERIEEVIETSKQEESSKEMEQLSEAEGIGEGVVADKQNGEMKQSADKQKQNEEVNGKLTDSKVSEDFEKPSEQEQQVVSDESKSAKQSSGEIEISASMEDNNDNSKVIPPPIILASCPCDGPHKNGQHTHAPTTHKTTEVITVGDVPTEEKVVVDKNVITLDSAVSPEQFAANVAKLAEEHPELMKSANLEQLGEGVTGKLTVTTYTTTTTAPQEAVKVAKRDPVVLPVEREQRAEMLRQKRERVYKLLPRDIEFCTRMIETYGDDYEAMVNDAANIYRDTAKSIQRKIRVFRKSPQFEVYLKSKNNSPQTSPIPSS
ncbi:unnamed protein product, partial [Anisakis simplex]|uniref:Microtubule-associated protein n=1 Tax=Anisakis simplex TaxID=6269 RepID=A0A0M3JYP9_ANISI